VKLRLKVTPSNWRRLAAEDHEPGTEGSNGRYPLAWWTYGYLKGHGWGFLPPWAQLAIFPEKGTQDGIGHPHRMHEPFAIVRVFPVWMTARHRNHEYAVSGRYWWGLAMRTSWLRPRLVLLDPDKVRPVERVPGKVVVIAHEPPPHRFEYARPGFADYWVSG
jgi:hypothetical protein